MSNESGPSTLFAGDSNPNADKNTKWGIFLVSFIFAPVAIITAFITYLTFSVGRVHYRVLSVFVAVYGLILLLANKITSSIESYVNSWLGILEFVKNGMNSNDILPTILYALWQQAPISILVGGIVGIIYSWWAYFRMAGWEKTKFEFRLSPLQVYKKNKNINDIKNNKNGPANGKTLGINAKGEKIIQTEKEAAAHTFVVGASGVGKTTTLLLGARDAIRRGEGYVFVDMKGTLDVAEILGEYAKRYNRPFYHWTSHDPKKEYTGPAENGPAYYDPLGRGDATRRANLLLEGRNWSEDHYKIIIQDYLQKAFEISLGVPSKENVDAIADVMSLLDPMDLKKRSLHVVGDPYYHDIVTEINYLTDKKIDNDVKSVLDGMRRQLGILRDSLQGRWLRKDPTGNNNILFSEVAHNGGVVVFTVDSANYKNNAQIIGNLIIQDLMTVASELRADPPRNPLNVIIDEFSAIGSDNIIGLIARSRDANIPVTLSTQSLGDLKAVSNEFMEQLTGIVSAFIIHRPNRYEDAEVYAGFVGKEKKQVFRQNVEHTSGLFGSMGKGAGTGKGSLDTEEDYIISPSQIQKLAQGEIYYISKASGRIEWVKVIPEDGKIVKKNANAVVIPTSSSSSFISSQMSEEDRKKYAVDPSVNGKPSLTKTDDTFTGDDDFDKEYNVVPEVKKSDPERIRAIIGRKSFDEVEAVEPPKAIDTSVVEQTPSVAVKTPKQAIAKIASSKKDDSAWDAKEETNVAPTPQLPPKPLSVEKKPLPSTVRPAQPKPLPAVSKRPLPPKTTKTLPSLPPKPEKKREDIDTLTSLPKVEKRVKPVGAKPIKPQKQGSLPLPPIFPSPSKNFEVSQDTPQQEKANYQITEWDDEEF